MAVVFVRGAKIFFAELPFRSAVCVGYPRAIAAGVARKEGGGLVEPAPGRRFGSSSSRRPLDVPTAAAPASQSRRARALC